MKQLVLSLFLVMVLAGPTWAGTVEADAAYRRGDYETAARYYQVLAERGDVVAQFGLGLMYDDGVGVPQDYAQAVKWYRRAAAQDHSPAQISLGVMYSKGEGARQDTGEAMKWWRKAAAQGVAVAKINLGLLYAKGEGVAQDYVRAHTWFTLAASQQPPSGLRDTAVEARNSVAKNMTPDQITEAQRLAQQWSPNSDQETF